MADDKKEKLPETNKELEEEFKNLTVNERDFCNIMLKYLKIKNIEEIKAIDQIKMQKYMKTILLDMLQKSDYHIFKNYVEASNEIKCVIKNVLENIFTNEVIKNIVFKEVNKDNRYSLTNSIFFKCLNEIFTDFDITLKEIKVLVQEVIISLRNKYSDEEN